MTFNFRTFRRTAWTITEDRCADSQAQPGTNANAVGLVGPKDCPWTSEQIKAHPQAMQFRMKDDDGNILYVGFLTTAAPYFNPLAPLEDFGTPNAGCTSIETLEGGKWVEN